MAQETALMWFIKELGNNFNISGIYDEDDILGSIERFHSLIDEAERKEKEQIVNAYLQKRTKGDISHVVKTWDKAEQYYNETYGTEQSTK